MKGVKINWQNVVPSAKIKNRFGFRAAETKVGENKIKRSSFCCLLFIISCFDHNYPKLSKEKLELTNYFSLFKRLPPPGQMFHLMSPCQISQM